MTLRRDYGERHRAGHAAYLTLKCWPLYRGRVNRARAALTVVVGILLLTGLACADREPDGSDKRSGIKVKPNALCENEGSEGSYDRVWYVCRKGRDGDLRWVKR